MEFEILSDNLSASSSGEDLLTLSIDMGDGRKDLIKIYQSSNPEQLALEFCSKHQLGAKSKLIITDEIEKNLLILPKRTKLDFPIHSSLSTGQGSSTPGEFTESTLKFSPGPQIKASPQVRQLKSCLYKPICASPEQGAGKLVENRVIKGSNQFMYGNYANFAKPTSTLKPSHKKSYSNLIRPADPNSIHLSPNIFKSPENLKKTYQASPSPTLKNNNNSKNKCKSPGRTEKLFNQMKIKAYRRIFDLLNPDSNGVINSLSIQNVSKEMKELAIISPILEELNIMNETLNFNEFFDAMEILMKFLNVSEKNLILVGDKSKIKSEISTQSRKNIRQIFTGPDLYERCMTKKNESTRRLNSEREKKEKRELEECFFQPNLCPARRPFQT